MKGVKRNSSQDKEYFNAVYIFQDFLGCFFLSGLCVQHGAPPTESARCPSMQYFLKIKINLASAAHILKIKISAPPKIHGEQNIKNLNKKSDNAMLKLIGA